MGAAAQAVGSGEKEGGEQNPLFAVGGFVDSSLVWGHMEGRRKDVGRTASKN